jgi:hypothetical protein
MASSATQSVNGYWAEISSPRVATVGTRATASNASALRLRITLIGVDRSQGNPDLPCWTATTTSRVRTQACRPSGSIPVL